MNNRKAIPLFFAIGLSLMMVFSSCKKDEEPLFPLEPFITLDSVSQTTLAEFQENLRLYISYQDGDGDLGFFHPDSNSIYVLDSRLIDPDEYHIQPLAPLDEVLPIQGSLVVELKAPFKLGSGGDEVIQFTVTIKDRAGNWSNPTISPDITITD